MALPFPVCNAEGCIQSTLQIHNVYVRMHSPISSLRMFFQKQPVATNTILVIILYIGNLLIIKQIIAH